MQPGKQTLADVRGKLGVAFQAVKNHLRKARSNRNALELPAIKAAIESGMADLLAVWAECCDGGGQLALSASKNALLRLEDVLPAFYRADDELGKFSADRSKVGYSEAKSNLERAMNELRAIWQAFVGPDGHMPDGPGVKLSATLPADANSVTRQMSERVFGGGADTADTAEMTAMPRSGPALLDQVCDAVAGLDVPTTDSVLRTYGVSRADYEANLPGWKARMPQRAAAFLSALPASASSPGAGVSEATKAMQAKVFPELAALSVQGK
jgi:hypothetical protein